MIDFAESKRIDREHLWHPYASIKNPPPINFAVENYGTRIRLENGTELIDGISSWWCAAHGHRHPAIMAAIRKQSEKMAHVMFGGFTHEPAVRLAEKLIDFLPGGFDRIFYADSGSISVECAVKMAVQYQHALGCPGKCRIAALHGAYHGDTAGAMALSEPDGMHLLFQGIIPKHYFADRPNCRFDENWFDRDFDSMAHLLEDHSDQIAAVIVEPVFQGGNGMWMYNPQYLRRLREECTRQKILLIFDEIATGFYRTGKRLAAFHAGVLPDIICLGKNLTGGSITLAATVTTSKVAEVISSEGRGAFMHGPTFMANPLACAAACASVDLFQNNDYETKVAAIERQLNDLLDPYRNHPNVQDVRVLGAIGVLVLRKLPDQKEVNDILLRNGVWLRPFSKYVYTMPPYITASDELAQIADTMGQIAEKGLFSDSRDINISN